MYYTMFSGGVEGRKRETARADSPGSFLFLGADEVLVAGKNETDLCHFQWLGHLRHLRHLRQLGHRSLKEKIKLICAIFNGRDI